MSSVPCTGAQSGGTVTHMSYLHMYENKILKMPKVVGAHYAEYPISQVFKM